MVDTPRSDPQRHRLEFGRRQVQYLATHVPQGHLAETFVLRPASDNIVLPCTPPPLDGVEPDPLVDRSRLSLGRKFTPHPSRSADAVCPWARAAIRCPRWQDELGTCSHLAPVATIDVPRIRHELLARHLRHPHFFLQTCVRWKYLPTYTPVVTLDPFHVLVSPATIRRIDGEILAFYSPPIPGVAPHLPI